MHEEEKPEIERRESFRLDMEEELIDIVWVDENLDEHKKKIICLDFSRGGLKVVCNQPITPNTNVMVLFKAANPNSQRLYGKVLRCIETSSGKFEIGLMLDDETP